MTNNKGITLIALVITIIVLLILAGVSIAMLTGDNGILTQAGNAKTDTAIAEAEEAVKLTLNEIIANDMDPTYDPGTGTDESVINKANLTTMIPRNNANVTVTSVTEDGNVTTNDGYYDVALSVNGVNVTVYVNRTTQTMVTANPHE